MEKFQSPHASVTCCRPQDGFNVLLRRHGGSKRNSLLRWCQNRTQGYKVSPLLLSPLPVNTNRVLWHLVNFLGTFQVIQHYCLSSNMTPLCPPPALLRTTSENPSNLWSVDNTQSSCLTAFSFWCGWDCFCFFLLRPQAKCFFKKIPMETDDT